MITFTKSQLVISNLPLRNVRRSNGTRLASSSQNSLSTYSDNSALRSSPSPTRQNSCPLHSVGSSTRASSSSLRRRKPSFLLALHVRDLGNFNFESMLTFPEDGRYEVNVTHEEKHVTGSPFKVTNTMIN